MFCRARVLLYVSHYDSYMFYVHQICYVYFFMSDDENRAKASNNSLYVHKYSMCIDLVYYVFPCVNDKTVETLDIDICYIKFVAGHWFWNVGQVGSLVSPIMITASGDSTSLDCEESYAYYTNSLDKSI